MQTSQGYIIRILQHFATKLWNITNFVMLFQAVMKFLSRLVEFKILVNWGSVHSPICLSLQCFYNRDENHAVNELDFDLFMLFPTLTEAINLLLKGKKQNPSILSLTEIYLIVNSDIIFYLFIANTTTIPIIVYSV